MKKILNQLLNKTTGYIITKGNRNKVSYFFKSGWINSFNLKTVIDVGANAGQFALSVRKAMPLVKIISFEPIPFEVEKIKLNFKNDSNFILYPIALGDTDDKLPFEVNEFSPSSSLLSYTKLQKEFYPVTGTTTKIEVQVKRLDKVLKHTDITYPALLKIDVQGFEDKVLLGSIDLLNKISIVYVECSFKQFYQNQPTFNDIYNILYQQGFEFKGIADTLYSGNNEEPVQIDAVFLNKNISK